MPTIFTKEEISKWHERQPKKTIGAKALLMNEKGELLLVKPTYQTTWQLPGGVVDSGEEPRQALVREIEEELAILIDSTKVRIVGTAFQRSHDALILIYSYNRRLQEMPFRLRKDEHEGYTWRFPDKAITMIDNSYSDFWNEYFRL